MIVIMAGLPATGKSTLCRELANRLSGTVLDKDEIRSALFPPLDIEYSTQQDDFCMRIVVQTAAYILKKNPHRAVFLDGRPYSRRYQLNQVIEQAEELNQPWRILECVCSDESAKARLENQSKAGTHPAADRDYEMYLRVKANFEEISQPKAIIDTDQPIEACVQSALKSLR
jgi:adenylylsulfate kinase